jgi:hypothetical protein
MELHEKSLWRKQVQKNKICIAFTLHSQCS